MHEEQIVNMESKKTDNTYYFLVCERKEIYHILIAVGGFFGAYTYLLRGNVFCNAQSGNVVIMGMALGTGKWREALYYLIPILAYILGAFVSELLPKPIKKHLPVRWDTLLVAIEMLAVLVLGCIPLSAPVQISQVTINFVASMQYNTFRQAEGVSGATTFVTNHIRQIGVGLAKEITYFHSQDKTYRKKLCEHFVMLMFFFLGAFVGTILCDFANEKAIWATMLPLGVILGVFLYADFVGERALKERKPAGH